MSVSHLKMQYINLINHCVTLLEKIWCKHHKNEKVGRSVGQGQGHFSTVVEGGD